MLRYKNERAGVHSVQNILTLSQCVHVVPSSTHTRRAQPPEVPSSGCNRMVPYFLSITEDRTVLGFFCSLLLFPPSEAPQEYPRTAVLGVHGVYVLNPTSLARQGAHTRSPQVWGPTGITTTPASRRREPEGQCSHSPPGERSAVAQY